MVKVFSIQFFSHSVTNPIINYFPYLFSTNLNPNYCNYFPDNYSSFMPFLSNNIVYPQQNYEIAQPLGKTVPILKNDIENPPIKFETITSLNNTQVPNVQIIHLCNRNVLPNNVSLILCFIRRIKKSGKLVQKIISKLTSKKEYTVKRFYSYQLYLKENCTDFKWKEGIEVLVNYQDPYCSAFSLEQQQFYNKVCRILIKLYLEQICRLEVLNHTKINKSYIQDHLKVIRFIRQSLKGKSKALMTIQYQ